MDGLPCSPGRCPMFGGRRECGVTRQPSPLWTYPGLRPPLCGHTPRLSAYPSQEGRGGAARDHTAYNVRLSHAYIVTCIYCHRIYIIWYNRNGISTMGGELKMGFSTSGGGNIEKNETFFLVFRILGYEKMVVNNFFWDFLAIIGKLVVLLHSEK